MCCYVCNSCLVSVKFCSYLSNYSFVALWCYILLWYMKTDWDWLPTVVHCVPKKVHLFIFQITLSKKLTDFNDFWRAKSRENFMSIACTFAHFTCILQPLYLGKSKTSFFNSIIHTYFRLFTLSQEKQTATVVLQLICLLTVVYCLLLSA